MKATRMILVCVILCLVVGAEARSMGRAGSTPECGGGIDQDSSDYYYCDISVAPAIPTVEDPVQVTAGGVWSHWPVPSYDCYSVAGDVIEVYFVYDFPPIVLPVIMPWGETVDVGTLPIGRYEVYAYINHDCCGTQSFTVFDEPRQVYLPAIVKQE